MKDKSTGRSLVEAAPNHKDISTATETNICERLREESLTLQKVAWGRMDGGQECSLSAALADEAATIIEKLVEALAKVRATIIEFDKYCEEGPVVRSIDEALSLARGESPTNPSGGCE